MRISRGWKTMQGISTEQNWLCLRKYFSLDDLFALYSNINKWMMAQQKKSTDTSYCWSLIDVTILSLCHVCCYSSFAFYINLYKILSLTTKKTPKQTRKKSNQPTKQHPPKQPNFAFLVPLWKAIFYVKYSFCWQIVNMHKIQRR